jgi:hydroxyethylthiazole kinase-like uncharacterized protein yjeF
MLRAYAADRVRAAEESAMAGLPEGELMARAARGLAEVSRARLAERGGAAVVGLVGSGNNGGDALYALAHLADAGYAASAVVGERGVPLGDKESWESAGVQVVDGGDPQAVREVLARADVVIDGILGIGGRPGLPDAARRWLDEVPDTAYVVSVDLPSGQDPAGEIGTDTGVFADETVTFGVAKPVHLLPATEAAVGQLTLIDIGLDVEGGPDVERLDFDDVAALWPVPGAADDKYSRGVLGIVAGGEAYTGAAVLSCTAAVESGVGMVRYVGPPTPTGLVRAAVPEAVHGPGRVQAWVVGPGLDVKAEGADAQEQLRVAREAIDSDLPLLVDAGGLALVAGRRDAPTLLTPHAGELATLVSRLTGDDVSRADVTAAPLRHARTVADHTGATVLLKGATTLVVPPSDSGLPVRSQDDAPPWLATAGAGDVLSGIAGTLLAAGLSPLDAGSLAALVHGVAADRANPGGPVRALAVAMAVPGTVAALLRR